jgi:hypothetical protein
VHSLANIVTEGVVITGFVGIDSSSDVIEDVNSVNEDILSNFGNDGPAA